MRDSERLGDCLGPLLYQLPAAFRRTPENALRLAEFTGALPREHEHAVEFRDASWFVDAAWEILRAANVAAGIANAPDLETPVVAAAPLACVRFHGTGEKYSGACPRCVLERWARRLEALPGSVQRTWLY